MAIKLEPLNKGYGISLEVLRKVQAETEPLDPLPAVQGTTCAEPKCQDDCSGYFGCEITEALVGASKNQRP